MIQTVDHVIALWAAAILGGLLIVIVVTFVFSRRFRRDVMHSSNNELAANGSIGATTERSGTFSVTARGSIIALVVSFLLALIAVATLPSLSRSQLATNTQASELSAEAEKTRNELSALIEKNSELRREAARLTSLRLEAFYIGEFARAPFGRHFPCESDTTRAALEVCGVDAPITIKAIASHAGNRCGYSFFAVACAPQ